MDNFRRYVNAYLAAIEHPFAPGVVLELAPTELEEAVAFVLQVLMTQVKEHRLADLDARFGTSFEQYLVVSRDQTGALVNAIERLATLLEPFLKKLVYLCYPRRTVAGTRTPLWHCTMDRIIRELALATADLGRTEDSYWQQQDLVDAIWRVAVASRHKGAHEAHRYNLVELERLARAILTCYVLAARRALRDPGSMSDSVRATARVRQLEELLTARTQTYRVTRDLPDPLEHLHFYEARKRLALGEEKGRLLFDSYLEGNGPVFSFLRSVPVPVQVQWAREALEGKDEGRKMEAIRFLFAAGEPLKLGDVVPVFHSYKHRYKLAFHIEALATRSDVQLLWKLHRHKGAIVREAVTRRLVGSFTDQHTALKRKIGNSSSGHTRELFLRLAVGSARAEKVDAYRAALKARNRAALRYALVGLGKVGSKDDFPLLEQFIGRAKVDRWTRDVAIVALCLLALRAGDHRRVRTLLRDGRGYVVKAALKGMALSEDAVPIDLVNTLYRRFPKAVGEVLRRRAGERDRGRLRALFGGIKLDDAAKGVAVALAAVGRAGDIEFVIRRIAKEARRVEFWDQYELVFALARPASGGRLRSFLRRFIAPREFWDYYGETRPREKMPVTNYENLPLVKRLVGLPFGAVATRRDIPLLHRLLEHSYWPVSYGAAIGLARVGGDRELEKVVTRAVSRAETGKDIGGLLQAACLLDERLFGKHLKQLPLEVAFGDTHSHF